MKALEAIGLTYSYPGQKDIALKELELSVAQGAFQGILGPNGAGKTTFIRMACSLLQPNKGHIQLFDKDVCRNVVSQLVGYAPQEIALYNHLSAWENLQFFARLRPGGISQFQENMSLLLEKVGLSDVAHKRVSAFSGGMKRRLNLAVALLHSPRLLILDEPMTGVDPQSRNRILQCLKDFHGNGGTILYTSHYLHEVEKICETIAIMDHGKTLVSGTLAEIMGKKKHQLNCSFDKRIEDNLLKDLKSRLNHATIKSNEKSLTVITDEPDSLLKELLPLSHQYQLTLLNYSDNARTLEDRFLELTGHSLRDG
ncbi:MAG: ABC transporter ATP-binding protein [Planctomycetes bacterium]|nr:ABC transporter ATP-binding protein [Planctomycetota bacterium]